MTKVSFIMPARNKASVVAKTVETILAQSYSPMQIVLSDQGSTDGTLDVIRKACADHFDLNPGNIVEIAECPLTEYRGRRGMNDHLWWIINEVADGDLIIMCAADDLNHKDRAKHVVDAYENAGKTNPNYIAALETAGDVTGWLAPDPWDYRPALVGCRMRQQSPEGKILGESMFPNRRSRWIDPVECIQYQIGSSGAPAWTRDLWMKYGPLGPCESDDMILPILACFERGLYFVDKPLHTYVTHASLDNTGMEGIVRACPEGSTEQFQAIETANYHMTSHWCNVARKLQQYGFMDRLPHDGHAALAHHICKNADYWTKVRDHLTAERIPPVNMVV